MLVLEDDDEENTVPKAKTPPNEQFMLKILYFMKDFTQVSQTLNPQSDVLILLSEKF